MERKVAWMERSSNLKAARDRRREEVDVDATRPAAEAAETGSGNVDDGSLINDPGEAEEQQSELLRNESLGLRPGAIAVHGPWYQRGSGGSPGVDTSPLSRPTRLTNLMSRRGRNGFVAVS
jgi:hypothetical protein